MRRRDFLSLAGSAAALGALSAACSSRPAGTGTISTSPPPTSGPSTVPSTTTTTTTPAASAPTSAEWARLSRSLDGNLVLPSSSGYLLAAESYNPVFDGSRPKAIAYVASPADVAGAIGFGRDHSLPLSIRSGGHCYGGWSTGDGLVIDVSKLSSVEVSAGSGTVVSGSGARLVDFYAAIAPSGRAVPGGSCPTVGIAGLALGGGLGVLDRKFGLTCDNLVSAQIVLASGELVTCDATRHPDLFWALR
ncbi:MAG: FAD-binding oxidoreductase, partial [Acidimicrobiales bacterium]